MSNGPFYQSSETPRRNIQIKKKFCSNVFINSYNVFINIINNQKNKYEKLYKGKVRFG